jgi:N-acetyl sugar amidotransferase
MIYCTRCLYPDTKPDLTFDENGVCSACLAFEARKSINWEEREEQFKNIVTSVKHRVTDSNQPYHCVIPVSGGKDSHYQVIKALEYGLRPLAVTAITDDLTDIGARNLFNISKLGVDHVFVATDARLRRRINRYTLETIGDISWAEHVTIFSIPVREALLRRIPLILWGENPQNEYGGPTRESQNVCEMRDVWLQEFGGLNGLRVQDLVLAGIANMHELKQYYYPSRPTDGETVKALFLGQFFPWSGIDNYIIAKKHGFEPNRYPVECSGVIYENLDNYQTGIHDRFKYLKFGFGRATDIACNHIRRGIMTREEGIDFVEEFDSGSGEYLGKTFREIARDIGLSWEDYIAIEQRFANPDLFEIHGMNIRQKFTVGKNA